MASAVIIPHATTANIEDSFEFCSVIGQGSFGIVRNVRDKHTNEHLACKTLEKSDKIPGYILRREVESLRRIQCHPHLIELKREIYEDDDHIHILMELCTGGELYDRVATGRWAIPERDAVFLISNILRAIVHSHERGVVHRDLKASNFLFATKKTNTNIKIIDFGLSISNEREEEVDDRSWVLKSKVGTPYYVAPEVMTGDSYSSKCDVWSIGVITYVVLTRGRLPYLGKDEEETLQLLKDASRAISFSQKVWNSYSPAAKDFCKALLERDPTKRPTAREALELEWTKHPPTTVKFNLSLRSLMLCVAVVLIAVALASFSVDLDMDDDQLRQFAQDLSILVTGANSGLGLATVKLLGQFGTAKTIVLACRNATKCEEARHQVQLQLPESSKTRVTAVQLDLANKSSIDVGASAVQHFLWNGADRGDPPALDVLVNNAGVMFAWTAKEFVEGVEMHVGINHLGHVYLTHLLWRNLLASSSGARLVHVSSLGALVSWRSVTSGWYKSDFKDGMTEGSLLKKVASSLESMACYFQSKRANLILAWELHQRYHTESGITSVASHPGYTRTEGLLKAKLPLSSSSFKEWLYSNPWMSMSTEDGARTQLVAALASSNVPSGSYVVPKYWTTGAPVLIPSLMTRLSSHFWSFSGTESATLWDESMKALGISEFGELNQ